MIGRIFNYLIKIDISINGSDDLMHRCGPLKVFNILMQNSYSGHRLAIILKYFPLLTVMRVGVEMNEGVS